MRRQSGQTISTAVPDRIREPSALELPLHTRPRFPARFLGDLGWDWNQLGARTRQSLAPSASTSLGGRSARPDQTAALGRTEEDKEAPQLVLPLCRLVSSVPRRRSTLRTYEARRAYCR